MMTVNIGLLVWFGFGIFATPMMARDARREGWLDGWFIIPALIMVLFAPLMIVPATIYWAIRGYKYLVRGGW